MIGRIVSMFIIIPLIGLVISALGSLILAIICQELWRLIALPFNWPLIGYWQTWAFLMLIHIVSMMVKDIFKHEGED